MEQNLCDDLLAVVDQAPNNQPPSDISAGQVIAPFSEKTAERRALEAAMTGFEDCWKGSALSPQVCEQSLAVFQ